jgi:CheY-like chemotaxis protein
MGVQMDRLFEPHELAGARVVIAEDHDDSREMMVAFLASVGMKPVGTASGRLALEEFHRELPAVLVSDLAMPDGDGYELVTAIRALPADQGGLTPAIALSASASAIDAIGAGFHTFLDKPVDPVRLLDVIRDFVEPRPECRDRLRVSVAATGELIITAAGHVTAADVRAMTAVLLERLASSSDGYDLVVDATRATTFDPSAPSFAERGAWAQRRKIRSVTIVGAAVLARVVSAAACAILGIPCRLVDQWP